MRWIWAIVSLCFLNGHVWSAFVPVTLRRSASRLAERDVVDPAEVLQPIDEVDLLYADDGIKGSPMLVTVTAKHDSHPYVVLERFEDLLSTVTCTGGSNNESTTISMNFLNHDDLTLAEQIWSGKAGLTFITHHHSCNPNVDQREVYRALHVRFDHNSSTAFVTGDRKEFGYTDANTGLRIQGSTTPRHLRRRIYRRSLDPLHSQPRSLRPRDSPTERVLGYSYYRKWRQEELVFTIPGQVDVHCLGCSSVGELRLGFDFDIQSLDPGRIQQAAADVINGLKPEPMLNKAIITAEVVEPVDMKTNLRVKAHTGLSVRWPGLVMPTSNKPTLGSFLMKDKEIPLFNLGAFQFFTWWAMGFVFVGWFGGSMEMDIVTQSTAPVGTMARINLLAPSESYINPALRRTVNTRWNKGKMAVGLDLVLGLVGDITFKIKIPDGDWRSLLNKGGGRGPIGFKDDVLKWYAGGYIAVPEIGIQVASPAGLDANCQPSEETSAVRIDTELRAGFAPYMQWVFERRGKVIPRLAVMPYSPNPDWYKRWPLGEVCFVVGRQGTKSPAIIPNPADLQPKPATPPDPWWLRKLKQQQPQHPQHPQEIPVSGDSMPDGRRIKRPKGWQDPMIFSPGKAVPPSPPEPQQQQQQPVSPLPPSPKPETQPPAARPPVQQGAPLNDRQKPPSKPLSPFERPFEDDY
ncbi:MAG: Replication factor C (RF-C) subunit [Watsoniomyces obsoletus]|nr:MAG: Replication factor C (RF-C) subunit [Watsoniomyces obsoletus]